MENFLIKIVSSLYYVPAHLTVRLLFNDTNCRSLSSSSNTTTLTKLLALHLVSSLYSASTLVAYRYTMKYIHIAHWLGLGLSLAVAEPRDNIEANKSCMTLIRVCHRQSEAKKKNWKEKKSQIKCYEYEQKIKMEKWDTGVEWGAPQKQNTTPAT